MPSFNKLLTNVNIMLRVYRIKLYSNYLNTNTRFDLVLCSVKKMNLNHCGDSGDSALSRSQNIVRISP